MENEGLVLGFDGSDEDEYLVGEVVLGERSRRADGFAVVVVVDMVCCCCDVVGDGTR